MRRARGCQILGLACALLLAAPWAAPSPAAAGIDHVTTCAGSGVGSLPDVVAHAAADATVVFDLNCFSSNSITLTSTITIGVNLRIDATSPLHDALVDGGGAVTVFTVRNGVTATLSGLTIQHGFGGSGDGGGGGIHNSGTLTVLNSVFSGNTAVGAPFVGGGAIRNDGTLLVTNSILGSTNWPGNSVSNGPGGGIANYGDLTVTNSSFGSSQPFSGNSGTVGGAIYDRGRTLTVTNSSFAQNSASAGGGIFTNDAATTVTNSTLTLNRASQYGGGIDDSNCNCPLAVTNTIIAGNSGAIDAEVHGSITSGGHNFVGGNPLLGASSGGPTPVMRPLFYSPVIGAGDASVCRQTGAGMVNGLDQQGLPRLPSTCDIGASQVQGTRLAAGLSRGDGPAGAPDTLTVAIFDGYGNPLAPYTGTVHFASSDPLATLPADYTFTGKGTGNDNGAHIFTVAFRTAGTQRMTATDNLSGTLTAQATAAITPVVASVSPASGGTGGGNRVTLTGLGFGVLPATVGVTIGGSPATVGTVTNTALIVTAPSHPAGTVDVVVTVNGQSTTVTNGYTYGVVNPLPGGRATAGTPDRPGPLPSARPTVVLSGNPSPLPPPRP